MDYIEQWKKMGATERNKLIGAYRRETRASLQNQYDTVLDEIAALGFPTRRLGAYANNDEDALRHALHCARIDLVGYRKIVESIMERRAALSVAPVSGELSDAVSDL